MTKDKEEFSILRELWFPLLFGFILLVLMAGGYFLAAADTKTKPAAAHTSKELGKNVILFLNDLKNKEPKEAYDVVSKEFKASMPYPKFVQFLSDYPILTVFEKIEPGTATLEGKTVVFPIVLSVGNTAFPVNFTLMQEGGEWKILGFVINQVMTSGQDQKDLDMIKTLSQVALDFLNEIKKDQLEEAYQNLTTEEFKKGNPSKTFLQYVQDRPIFKADTVLQVMDGHVDGGRGYLKMHLKDGDKLYPIDFTLREEKDGWKIEGVYLLAPVKDQPPAADQGK